MTTLALDIGGTKLASGLWQAGQLARRQQQAMPQDVDGFHQLLHVLARAHPAIDRLAVALTGRTDGSRVHAVNPAMIGYWDGFPLRDALARHWSCPTVLLNDAQAAAWGEFRTDPTGMRDLLFVTLSTGVGGGLVLDAQLRTGSQGLAGHIGHSRSALVPIDGIQHCACGQLGCLETLASGTALARQARYLGRSGASASDVFAAAQAGDASMQALIEQAAQGVALALASATALADLQSVVIGGSVGLATGMAEAIARQLDRLPAVFRVPVRRARLGADAGLV
ncbi:MAG: ROK family protein, partial [Rhodoferax sp.]|nr:ROK family protein [Rhodoferax sp.]